MHAEQATEMKKLKLKRFAPEFAKSAYHKVRAFGAASMHRFPAEDMIIIGITGTKGKTSTANYIWSVLTAGGYTAGLISTALFRIGTEETANTYHMTMPDPFLIQKKLNEMRKRGVSIAVVEMTSEGMKQFRHLGIPVDIAVFTNLTPEHLASHKGSFEVYKKAKAPLFLALDHKVRTLMGKPVPRTIIANSDSEHAAYYLGFAADKKITFGLLSGDIRAADIVTEKNGTMFTVAKEQFRLSIPGAFNVYNALPACAVGTILGIASEKIAEGLRSLKVIPGRMETIEEGQDFIVVVDYAHEPASLGALITAAEALKDADGKVILLTGIIGGGRESRIPLVRVAAKRADYLVITNEDPYDEDPKHLIETLAEAAMEEGKQLETDLFTALDRRDGIRKALSLAHRGDIVLISGKGAEHTMMTKRGAEPWNEREIVRELVRAAADKQKSS